MYIPDARACFHTMASLIPIFQEVLPMLMPASISVTKSAEILPPTDQTTSGDQADDRTDVSPKTVIPAAAPTPAPTPTPASAGGSRDVRVISRDAVVGRAESMCATVLVVKPQSATLIHHNGEQETIVYVTSGKGALLSQPKDEDERHPERQLIEKGDFAYIPAWLEHQAVNESDVEDLMLVVVRSGATPVEVNLKTWGGSELKSAKP
ncbi:hypothetical protein QBC40DRAFT_105981 [Triangularia verruculosa]|uniref:Cupin type-2 domain-containing protein n=1 Tax=Triangularia verruculosa TaxID=2587418 RepID=A0AAN6XGL7_9PEZI|nr:hypothetical protein QBC40DRAFT_105981 [Triangularia verruculosa]